MKYVYQSLRVVTIIMVQSIIGCATVPPTQEMSDARQALKAAYNVNAEQFVPDTLFGAESSLKNAEKNLELGQLSSAREEAVIAKEKAVRAHNMAVAINRGRGVWQNVTTLSRLSEEVKALLQKMELSAKEGDADNTIFFAEEAFRQGKVMLNQTYLDHANRMLEVVKAQESKLSEEQRVILKSALKAQRQKAGEEAYQLSKRLFDGLSSQK